MYEWVHCGEKAVIWDNDFSFEDFGMDGQGIVHCCHCTNCGADVYYYVKVDNDEEF